MSIRYLYFRPRNPSSLELNAHLLVVKKGIYAPIAKVCVESFLFFHPKSNVTIHVDSHTFSSISKSLRQVIKRGKVSVDYISNEEKSWQDSKLELILQLCRPNEFFMDADLKWNDCMAPIKDITLFVNEFSFSQNSFYEPLITSKWFSQFSTSTMKNTSFFYWGGYKPTQNDRRLIQDIMQEIDLLTESSRNSLDFNQSTKRISEQIALSLLVETIGKPVNYLKDTDGFKDGSFVESSYFGATGSHF